MRVLNRDYLHGVSLQGSYSDLYPDSDDSSEDQIENSKNTWSCKVPTSCLRSLLSVFCLKFASWFDASDHPPL